MTHSIVDRREFLKTGAVAGASLFIGFRLPELTAFPPSRLAAPFSPNAWLEIAEDGGIRIWTGRSEMGQGVKTAMPMIVAEELEADWKRVTVMQADANPAYGDQVTVGSRSVMSGWMPLRKAGAAAREMLISAAALTWNVSRDECRARSGAVEHVPTGRKLDYGALSAKAATLPVPDEPPLKNPADFRILGTRVPRVDTPAKVTGRAVFGMDARVPGMLYAAVARCAVFGGKVKAFDPAPALAVSGVKRVEQIQSGVAVVAENTWAAFQGKKALKIEWDEGPTARWSSETISRAFAAAAQKPGQVVKAVGDVDATLPKAARTVQAVYEAPYLAHACMEPMNCTAQVKDGRCEIWAPTQSPQGIQRDAARLLGLPPSAVTVHVTYVGGGFGRRGGPVDYATEAVELAQKLNGTPVKVVWTREDDIQNGLYRPATYNVLRAGLDAQGVPVAWSHQLVGPDGPSFMLTRGADELIYPLPNFRLEQVKEDPGIPIAPWRGVGPSQNGWIVESFADELASTAGKDPVAFRRELVAGQPRLVAVLDLAAERAGWGKPAAGRHQGVALWRFGETYVAQVAEVSVGSDGGVRVHRVVCAADCGITINPDIVETQMQSSIVYGLTAALYGEITIERGRVVQTNFNNYRMLRQAEMPVIEVYQIKSDQPPGGVGEAGLPPLAAAVCNAVFAATGKRIRKLPIGRVV